MTDSDLMASTQGQFDNNDALSDIYGFLSLMVRYPDNSFFGDTFLDTLEALLLSLEMKDFHHQIHEWRSHCQAPLDDLQIEYTRLFINGSPKATIPPYASVYMDGDANIHGRTTEKTRDFYRQRGFDLVNETEPADHLQHELEFLAALVRDNQLEDEELFLKTLFRPWFQRFQEKSKTTVRHPYYLVAVELIDFLTKEEQ